MCDKMNKFRLQNWDGDLFLITPELLKFLKEGTVLHSINGRTVVIGKDEIDLDTRGGYLAYGFKRK